jgi:raffinose/stachyose/melibiose transport system substrate-binding protein
MKRSVLKKCVVLTVLVMFTGFAVFAGGSKEEPKAQEKAEKPAKEEKIVIEFWSWNNEGSYPIVHEDAEMRFEKDYPNVDVKREYISYTEYLVKLKAVLSGQEAPNVFQIPWAGEYTELARSGKLLPLTDHLKSGFPKFFPNIMNAISVDGDAWAVPLDLNTLQIAYNKTLFNKMGFGVPKSKDELIQIAQKLADQGKFAVALGTKDLWAGADVFFAQIAYTDPSHTKMAKADAGEISWNSPEFLKAVQIVDEYQKKGVIAPGANSMDAFVGAKNLFVQQQAAMFYPVGNFVTGGITADVGDSFEWSLFPWPPIKSGDEMLPTGGVAEMFVVAKDSDNQDIALDFLRYLTNDAGKEILVKNDFIPSSDFSGDVVMTDLYSNMLNAQSKSQSRVVYNTIVYTAVMNGMQGIYGQTLTPKQFIDSLVEAAAK